MEPVVTTARSTCMRRTSNMGVTLQFCLSVLFDYSLVLIVRMAQGMAVNRPGTLARMGVLALLWGSSFLWIKIALTGLSPVQIALGRTALGALVLVVLVLSTGQPLP